MYTTAVKLLNLCTPNLTYCRITHGSEVLCDNITTEVVHTLFQM